MRGHAAGSSAGERGRARQPGDWMNAQIQTEAACGSRGERRKAEVKARPGAAPVDRPARCAKGSLWRVRWSCILQKQQRQPQAAQLALAINTPSTSSRPASHLPSSAPNTSSPTSPPHPLPARSPSAPPTHSRRPARAQHTAHLRTFAVPLRIDGFGTSSPTRPPPTAPHTDPPASKLPTSRAPTQAPTSRMAAQPPVPSPAPSRFSPTRAE